MKEGYRPLKLPSSSNPTWATFVELFPTFTLHFANIHTWEKNNRLDTDVLVTTKCLVLDGNTPSPHTGSSLQVPA
jgi:hypothetical protein